MDSFSNLSIGDVSGALNQLPSPSDSEKKLDFCPDLSYSGSGATTANNSLRLSSFPSSAASLTSVASSIPYPSPVRTRQDSTIEISSVHRNSSYGESINEPTSHSPLESSDPQTQPANHSAV